jgi:hypothetical protein
MIVVRSLESQTGIVVGASSGFGRGDRGGYGDLSDQVFPRPL